MKGNLVLKQPDYSGNNHVIQVDGTNDYIDLGDTANLRYSKANIDSHGLTVAAWHYGIGTNVGHAEIPLLRIGGADGTDNNYYGTTFSINNAGNMVAHLFGTDGSGGHGAGSQHRQTAKTTNVMAANRWNLLVWVLPDSDKANWQFYVNNGVAQTMSTSGTATTFPVYYSSPKTYIGFNGRDGSASYVNYGYIGDVAIWNTELTQNAIQALYSRATAAPAANGNDLLEPTGNYTQAHALSLKGWWRMGDPYGSDSFNKINDEHTVNSNDTRYTGTMTNMANTNIKTLPLWG